MNTHTFAIGANDDIANRPRAIVMEEVGPRIISIEMGEDSYKLAVIIRKIIENPEIREEVERIIHGF